MFLSLLFVDLKLSNVLDGRSPTRISSSLILMFRLALTLGGGLIRKPAGDWITGFMRNIGCTESAAAELWVLRDGLSLCVPL